MDCQENEYWDQWGRCVTCQQCGPGQELSKDCGYGEGGDAYCTVCPPRRYKNSWGYHRCQACITCTVINRVQKANCTATSNAICGDCLPRFYRKTRIGGLQDQECIPCTKQTPTSEVQCAFQLSLVKADKADGPRLLPQEATLVALVSSLLVVLTLTFLVLFFLYCKQFFSRHCQHGDSLQLEADEAAEESLFPMPPGQETCPEYPVSESIFENQPLNPILDDDCSSTLVFPIQKSFTVASCASESHSNWVHTPIECTELDLQKFSNSASYTVADTFERNTGENSGDRLELNVPFQVLSP
ncbi:tumor necrosis factor receptor superfamily member 27 isoform X2 [Fukomys damarensis]|uniref:Tumor necrosis factor receptor superfamily member 27 n=1 Tax=Fukomys damarensis TaxID=885580 RepID=A0A091DHB1_FUKDA|nr:tumor necrosis factor receptor superfamily member 27 isoform X2 [Fukomys damarensis]KFO29888.1 Tumor necrosis factor receptor superfamily member 27 [Fukomys damarensis]